jgi:hypothetical protein
VIVDEMELISRLRDVDPLPPDVAERAMQTLRAAMGTSEPAGAAHITRASRFAQVRHPRRLAATVVATAAALIALIGVVTLMPGDKGSLVPLPTQGSPLPTRPSTGQTMHLASYNFRLPAGYATAASACTALPTDLASTIPADPATGLPTAAATSADGGCVEAALVAREVPIPAGAQAVEVGPYTGFVSTSAYPSVDLYVEIPAFRGYHDLVLAAKELTANQLVAIAKSGLPPSLPPLQACTTNCG